MHATPEDDIPSEAGAPAEIVAEKAQDLKHVQAKMKTGLCQAAEGSDTPY